MASSRTALYLALALTTATTVQSIPHHREAETRFPDPRTAALSISAPASASGGALGQATPTPISVNYVGSRYGGAVDSSSPLSPSRERPQRGRYSRHRTREIEEDHRRQPGATTRPYREHKELRDGARERNQHTRTQRRPNRDREESTSVTASSTMAAAKITESSTALPTSSSVDLLDAWGDRFVSVANELASALVDDPSSTVPSSNVLSTSVSVASTTPTTTPTATTTNALEVLQSAIPSQVRQGLESVFPGVFGDETTSTTRHQPTRSSTTTGGRTSTRRPNRPNSTSHSTTRPSNQPTRHPGDRPNDPPHNRPPPHGFPNTTTTHSPTTLSTSTSHTLTTPTTTISPAGVATGRPPPNAADQEIGAHPIPTASVAGIASGLVAGAVMVFLGGAYYYRQRRKQNKPFLPESFASAIGRRHNSQRSGGSGRVYPEVAWLYDPVISRPDTPSAQHTRHGSDAPLVPPMSAPMAERRGSSADMSMSAAASARRDSGPPYDEPINTPELGRGRRAESPLLAPQQLPEIRVQREGSPYGARGDGAGYLRLPGREDDQGA